MLVIELGQTRREDSILNKIFSETKDVDVDLIERQVAICARYEFSLDSPLVAGRHHREYLGSNINTHYFLIIVRHPYV